jgi:hypothetical protein
MRDDLEPGGLLGGDLGLLHPSLPLGVGAGGDVGGRRVAADAQGIIEVATAQVLQRHPELSPRGRVEDIGRRVDVDLGIAVRVRSLGEAGNRPDQAEQVLLVQPEPGGLGGQVLAVGRPEPPLGGAEADPTLQLVELLLPLGPAGDGQLGVVGRAAGRVAQKRPSQGGDLVEVELIGVPVLGVPRPHRPRRLLAMQRGLDLGPIGPGIDLQPGIVVRDHGMRRC